MVPEEPGAVKNTWTQQILAPQLILFESFPPWSSICRYVNSSCIPVWNSHCFSSSCFCQLCSCPSSSSGLAMSSHMIVFTELKFSLSEETASDVSSCFVFQQLSVSLVLTCKFCQLHCLDSSIICWVCYTCLLSLEKQCNPINCCFRFCCLAAHLVVVAIVVSIPLLVSGLWFNDSSSRFSNGRQLNFSYLGTKCGSGPIINSTA